MRRIKFVAAILIMGLWASICVGCIGPEPEPEPENEPPQIQIGTNLVVAAGESKDIQVIASDPDNDPVVCSWSATRGTVPSGKLQCANIKYTAPDSPGGDTVSVTASDGHGNIAEATLIVQVVEPDPRDDVDEDAVEADNGGDTPIIKIENPHKILTCAKPITEMAACQFEISGKVEGVESFNDVRIYTFVYPLDPSGDGWYIQQPPGSLNADGTWVQSFSYLGSDGYPAETGHTLRIRAALVTLDATYNNDRLDSIEGSYVLSVVEDIDGLIALSDLVTLEVDRGDQ